VSADPTALPGQLPFPTTNAGQAGKENNMSTPPKPVDLTLDREDFTTEEAAALRAVYPDLTSLSPDGQVVVILSRSELRGLALRYPGQLRSNAAAPNQATPPPSTGDAVEDAKLAARYPNTKW
jgi:hypothetical protein